MADIVLGIGTSHTPLLALNADEWRHRAEFDYANPKLNLSDGRELTYPQLLAETSARYESEITPGILQRKEEICEAAVERLADALHEASPDVVVIVGDDQGELFSPANQPAIAVYHGDEIVTLHGKYAAADAPEWMRSVGRDYLLDKTHRVPAAPTLGLELIEGLIERHIDVSAIAHVEDPARAGFGHAFGFVIKRLFRQRSIPVVPVLLNTYFPPNVPTSARCYDMGVALREAIEASASSARVAIIASGGLSHFVVDEAFDRKILAALEAHDTQTLRSIKREALKSGSSEILNWIMVAGAMANMPFQWHEYQPLYRTPAGTGVGSAFCLWQN